MSDVVNETTVSDVVPTEPKHAMPHAWRSVFGFWLTLGKWLLLLGALLYVSEALTEGPYSNIFGSGVDLIGYFVMMATPLAAFPAGLRLSIRPGPQLDRRAIVYSLLTIGVVAVLFNGYASPALARMNLRVPPSGYRPPNAQYLHEVRATLRDMKAQRERLTLPKLPNDSSRARVLESFRRESRILRYNIEGWQQHYSLVLAHSILPVIGASLGWVVGLWARLIPARHQVLFCWLMALVAMAGTVSLIANTRAIGLASTLLGVPLVLLLSLGGTWLLAGQRTSPLIAD